MTIYNIPEKEDVQPVENPRVQLTAEEFNTIVAALKDVDAKKLKQVFLTQAQYDALVSSGQIEQNTLYNIYEE